MDLSEKDDPQFKQGCIYAIRLLAASKKSERELLKRLSEKGYPEFITQRVIEHLKSQGLLSDQKLVQDTVQCAVQAKRYGRNRLSLELRRKGVRSSEISKGLEQYPKALERETARVLAKERWEKLKKVERRKRKKRVYDFLINRGFDFEMSREIIAQMQIEPDENF